MPDRIFDGTVTCHPPDVIGCIDHGATGRVIVLQICGVGAVAVSVNAIIVDLCQAAGIEVNPSPSALGIGGKIVGNYIAQDLVHDWRIATALS